MQEGGKGRMKGVGVVQVVLCEGALVLVFIGLGLVNGN